MLSVNTIGKMCKIPNRCRGNKPRRVIESDARCGRLFRIRFIHRNGCAHGFGGTGDEVVRLPARPNPVRGSA